MTRNLLILFALVLFVAGTASATVTFTQLDEDVAVVSHRVKFIGSRAKALDMAYVKAASLCVAAGFTHFEILDQESNPAQEYEDATATVTARFHHQSGEGLFTCKRKAESKYVAQAEKKLQQER